MRCRLVSFHHLSGVFFYKKKTKQKINDLVIVCLSRLRYSKVMQARKSTSVLIDSRTSAVLKTDTRWVCEDTSTLLVDSQIRHAISYGGQNVIFTKGEIARIKAIGTEPGTSPSSSSSSSYSAPHHL
jgi:hypothetical protein